MVQNLKVDIIYHSTASDFEMEFNLCGCCRMRLLNDKTSDKKTFIKALARGVSRSRVIIACGPLFGNDGLINTVAIAIGNGLTLCDNKTYGINSEENIHIINGSTPLVTPDGYFGGCIIESGPQTIILLTENRAFRKAIMQNLIHPYLEEISYIPTKSSILASTPAETESPFDEDPTQEEFLTAPDEQYGEEEFEESAYEAAPLTEDEHNIEFVMDEDSTAPESKPLEQTDNGQPAIDEAYNIMYTEVEKSDQKQSHYSETYTPSESDNMFVSLVEPEEPIQEKQPKTNLRAMDITIVILVLLLLLAVLALVYLLILRPMTMGISTGNYIKEIFGLTSSTLV